MAEKEPPLALGKQAFDVEHAPPAHGPEVDSRGLRKSGNLARARAFSFG